MRPDAWYVTDGGEMSCGECAINGASLAQLDNLPRRMRAALRLAQSTLTHPDPSDVVRILDESDRRWTIYRSGPWEGLPFRVGPGGARIPLSDEELSYKWNRAARSSVIREECQRAWWDVFHGLHDWDMGDCHDGEYCGGCNEELSPPMVTCDGCGYDSPVSMTGTGAWSAYAPFWPDDVIPTNDGDGTGYHVDRCDRCPEDD